MKKFILYYLFMLMIIGVLPACSSGETIEQQDVVTEMTVIEDSGASNAEEEGVREKDPLPEEMNRKIMYHANLNIIVKNLDQSMKDIQDRTEEVSGYVVESMVQGRDEGGIRTGHLTVRVPQEDLQAFIQFVEESSSRVIETSITGQDVTEEYVDLQTRLKSKQVVEERLLEFMEEAEKTEDLLTISNDLARVQEEIEELKGRINYLNNRIDLATVTIFMEENDISLASGKDLNIWDKTKEQFIKSIQLLITTLSNLFIFVIGNLPIFIFIGLIGLVIYVIRRRWGKNKE